MIIIRDELTARPGQGQALFDLYMTAYAPGARERGLTLTHTLVSPPLWLEDGVNTLLFVWTLPDAVAFWRKNNLGRRAPAVRACWARIEALAVSRRRDTFADPADFAALADV